MGIGFGLLAIFGLILFGILLLIFSLKYLANRGVLNRKKKMIAALLGINIVWLSVFGSLFLVLNSSCFPSAFRLSSCCPDINIDSDDNVNIYFLSYENTPESYYHITYVKIDSSGRIIDGPKFVENSTVDDSFERSETNITDRFGNRYILNIREYGIPERNFNEIAYILYTKINNNNDVIIENKTIAQHEPISHCDGSHAPSIFGIKMKLDSKDNLHIVWFVNRGPGNYFEVYYMKLDSEGNILVPQTRLYVFDYGNLAILLGLLAIVPVLSLIFYFLRHRRYKKDVPESKERSEKKNIVQNKKNSEG